MQEDFLAALIRECPRQFRTGQMRANFSYGKHSLTVHNHTNSHSFLLTRMQDGIVSVIENIEGQNAGSTEWHFVPELGFLGLVNDGLTKMTLQDAIRRLQDLVEKPGRSLRGSQHG